MFSNIFSRFRAALLTQIPASLVDNQQQPVIISEHQREILNKKVAFYSSLNQNQKVLFERRCLGFIYNTEFVGHDLTVSDIDKILIASGSVILAWGFKRWHYVKVDTVYLISNSFSDNSELGQQDSNITGLVGTAHLAGKMILSQPALHLGFDNNLDKRNVAIHEFAHLIDMADGDIDGLPRQITEQSYALPWLDLVARKILEIRSGKSDIRDYGATNNAEFFSVASEYFFERPKRLKKKHPLLYEYLRSFYKQNRADIQVAEHTRKKAPCPCGSGKRYKHCCLKQRYSI